MTEATFRSFVALPLPGEVQARIFAAAQTLAGELPAVRWSRKVENLHVTVKFLGQVAEERLDAVGEALGRALGALPRFGITVRGMGAFPSARHASVVWAGVDDSDDGGHSPAFGLTAVAQAVETATASLGFAREQRPFRAHVTVGRCKQGVDARAALAHWTGHLFGDVAVNDVHLYESRLARSESDAGSTYIVRSRAALGADGSN
jgi:2'-5' RNA ligase